MMIDLDLLNYLEGFLTEERKRRFTEVLDQRTNYLTVAMEDVFQLHNTSAAVRSCDAFGVQSLHVVQERYGDRLDKNIAMGAQKWISVHRHKSTDECLKTLREEGYEIVAATPHHHSVTLQDFEFNGKTALFFGTEWNGLSNEVLNKADTHLYVPMVGFTESLNVSVSVAITLQYLAHKLRQSDLDWQLSETEKQQLRLQWTKNTIKNVEGIIERYRAD